MIKYHLLLALLLLLFISWANAQTITHKGYANDSVVQEYVRYAYDISDWDLDFVAMLDAENGKRDPKRQSQVPDKKRWMSANGREDSRGFCQLHRRRHKNIVDDPKFFTDWKRQMEQCHKKYKWGTRFYWYDVRHKTKGRFVIWQSNEWVVEYDEVEYPQKTGCKRIWTAKEWQKVQADSHRLQGFLKVLWEFIVGKDEKVMVFICDK